MIPLSIIVGRNIACESIIAIDWLRAVTPMNSPSAILENNKIKRAKE